MTFSQLRDRQDIGILLAVGGGILFLGAASFMGYQYFAAQKTTNVPDLSTYYADMHAAFDEASTLASTGDAEAAQLVYADMLENATDQTVIEQTRLNMMRNAINISTEEAVRLAKELSADELISPQIRAAALEELGVRYMSEGFPDGIAFTDAFFTGEPYGAMREGTGATATEAAYMQLFAYANSISPRLLATAYLARYAGEQYWQLLQTTSAESEEAITAKTGVDSLLASLDDLLAGTSDNNPQKPLALVLKGVTENYILEDDTIGEGHINEGLALYETIARTFNDVAATLGNEQIPDPDGRGYFDAGYLESVIRDAESNRM